MYLKEEIEPKFPWWHDGQAAPVGYETWLDDPKRPWEQQLGTMAVKLMFILIQGLVFWLGFLGAAPSDSVFTYVGVLAIVVTIGALFVYPSWFL